ncbi:hypothetical protein PsYK624_032970 [Phanerochaete sordida]|uniref:Uncharacterized protein n=1 Tax=Phanerochaete sordida TaxID=48140 RepID=A0A9P3G420_9APHY|nr:hypothetical protein PsYK624_032970 [Phanerochaete sordida]
MSNISNLDGIEPYIDMIGVSVSQSLVPTVVESVVFGVYTPLVICTVIVIIRSQASLVSKKSVLLAVCVTMYGLSAAHIGISLSRVFAANRTSNEIREIVLSCISSADGSATSHDTVPCPANAASLGSSTSSATSQLVLSVPLSVNIMLSDVVVFWRAWVLSSRSRVVRLVTAVLMLSAAALLMWNNVADYGDKALAAYAAPLGFLVSWVTNLWATSLIARRAWDHRRHIKAHLSIGSHSRAERALLLFVESGSLYCLFWAPIVAASLVFCFEPRFSAVSRPGVNAAAAAGADAIVLSSHMVIAAIVIHVVGMYPTLVILLVELSSNYAQRALSVDAMPTLVPAARYGSGGRAMSAGGLPSESVKGSVLHVHLSGTDSGDSRDGGDWPKECCEDGALALKTAFTV